MLWQDFEVVDGRNEGELELGIHFWGIALFMSTVWELRQ